MNKHHEAAESALDEGYKDPIFHDELSRSPELILSLIQIQATLSLAHEQRTANLIALYSDGNVGVAPGVNYKDLIEQITDRLGL